MLQKVADRKIKRLMVFMPPRHGKSELVSRLFSAYWLYLYPHQWVAVASYGAELAHSLSRAARDFHTLAGGEIKSDAGAIKHWETGKGGGLWAGGVGGPATGKGWHLGIIDDPLKDAREASSAVIRGACEDWYGSVFYTREEPNDEGDPDGALVLVQTRWHEADLAGNRLAEERKDDGDVDPERWHIVNFEAIKEADAVEFPETCTVEPDWRVPGEALCPERRPLSKLLQIRRRIGEYFFGALFQQRPTPRDGTLFQVTKIALVDVRPAGLRACRGWDLAATENDGDWTAGIRVDGPDEDGIWYIDPLRFRHEPNERNRRIRRQAERDGVDVSIRIPKDPGAGGVEASQALLRVLAGYAVKAEPVSGSKELRAEPLAAQVNGGNVRVVTHGTDEGRAAADAFIEELRTFPNGHNDDQVDGASDAFNELADGDWSWDW